MRLCAGLHLGGARECFCPPLILECPPIDLTYVRLYTLPPLNSHFTFPDLAPLAKNSECNLDVYNFSSVNKISFRVSY